jgi:hypothetical protein
VAGPGWAAVWTLIASVVAAVAGTSSALIVKRRTDRLRAQLDFVNAQLRYFYGPLLALAEASQRSWKIFKSRHTPEAARHFWDSAYPPPPEARAAWLHWVTTILIPTNDRMTKVITERADLLIEPGMPQCLTDVYAHLLTIKAALASWNVESDSFPEVPYYPRQNLLDYLEDSFSVLKREQVRLLKAIAGTNAYPLTQNTSRVELISDRWEASQNRSASSA